jgi:tRNA1Val (adenine37-N6)-methyltransferase
MKLLSHKKNLPQGNFPQGFDLGLTSGLVLLQPGKGYRFTADAVALARVVDIAPEEKLLDLCSGIGVVPLLIHQRSPFSLGVLVEIQSDLASLARENIRRNGLAEKLTVVEGDVNQMTLEFLSGAVLGIGQDGFDVVCANPPYHRVGSGRVNPDPQKAVARHEVKLTLPALIRCAYLCLKAGGRFYLVHLAARKDEILEYLRLQGFEVARLEYADSAARAGILLVEALKLF